MNFLLSKGRRKMPKIPDKNSYKNQMNQSDLKDINFQKQSIN
ncbi:hypothetical protein FLA105534_03474 [Flavobacterium bizetiae]|uniref:Uncharacterized protein n=1 Tax=Flavobacterium bizetiae TaxID=2704140 RepID=A0A6J4GSV8_9FLAO|nr:hypothetical protein FLA105534_03474 [Flavobacterium bizetiae]CAD5340485.1 hypothetical protein FLA105535_00439 [Flavobacterium bizetiae]CAD5346890.1 hypothetical protein FLA105534_00833 [Flavobacterium bizetiae]